MTLFDDIQNEIDAGIEDIGFPTEGYHHIMKASEMIDELQERYAPTVEMTQEQYQQFIDFRKRTDSVQTHAVTLHDKKTKYPEFLNDLVGGVYGRLFLQAWLHPETIKIVDE